MTVGSCAQAYGVYVRPGESSHQEPGLSHRGWTERKDWTASSKSVNVVSNQKDSCDVTSFPYARPALHTIMLKWENVDLCSSVHEFNVHLSLMMTAFITFKSQCIITILNLITSNPDRTRLLTPNRPIHPQTTCFRPNTPSDVIKRSCAAK